MDTSSIRHFPKMDSSSIEEMSDWGSVRLRKCLNRAAFLSLWSVWKKKRFSIKLLFSGKYLKNDITRLTRHFFAQPKRTLFWTIKSYKRGFSGRLIIRRSWEIRVVYESYNMMLSICAPGPRRSPAKSSRFSGTLAFGAKAQVHKLCSKVFILATRKMVI